MSTMNRTRRALALAGVATLLSSLAACSSQPSASPSSPPTSTAASTASTPAPADDRTYTKADLASILTSVNTSLKLGGTVETQDGPQNDALDSLRSGIGESPTFSPASCKSLIESNVQLGSQGVVAGTLGSSRLNLIASTVAGTALPPSLMSAFTTTQTAILSTCKHLTVTGTVDGQDVSAAVDFARIPVTTDASQSVGFTEKFSLTGGGGGTTSTRTVVEAVDGNLLLLASGASDNDPAVLSKAIDAAVAAARN
jgi:hypothetical protein